MYNLRKKIQEQKEGGSQKRDADNKTGRISVRDRLLTQEIQDLTGSLPEGCQLVFPDANQLHEMVLRISPPTGYWRGGTFVFDVCVPLEYNIMPPSVTCQTKLWHPNIDEKGAVCLSILRSTSLDGTGWAPTRTTKDVVWGIYALFNDLLNFDDPLNVEAADLYAKDKNEFIRKVNHYIAIYAR